MKELIKKNDYSLYEDDNGELFIEVVCGSIGLYEVKIKLLQDEVIKYNSDHKYLDGLAYLISQHPDKYKTR